MKNPLIKQLLRPVFFLAVLTIICGFLARTLTHSETLSEYAAKRPEAAYEEEEAHIDEKEDEKTDGDGDHPAMTATDTAKETAQNTPVQAGGDSGDSENNPENNTENTTDATVLNRTVYRKGFYYEPLTDEVKTKITGISYPASASEALAISYDDLRYLSVLYYDFNGEIQTGELICNQGIAQDLVEIFYELYENEYQIEKIRLIEEYQGDDTASMADNNTSCFNYRVVDGTSSLSRHALGCAIDINPFYNPYVVFNQDGSGETYISPAGSEVYADRSKTFPYKIDENDLCYKLFKEHGFVWGGNWNSCKDYQHFQKVAAP